jgi:protein tyrosine phosphatase
MDPLVINLNAKIIMNTCIYIYTHTNIFTASEFAAAEADTGVVAVHCVAGLGRAWSPAGQICVFFKATKRN